MIDEFSDQEKYQQAWENVVSMVAATHQFLQQRGIDPSEMATFFGQTFASGWSEVRGDLEKIGRYVALNMTSLGCATETNSAEGKVTVTAR
jgi:hypothetical protein